mmetsp:Transcript_6706/g.21116  ORF Transcript_6706/g.21116 Transcript_6706/m.21116 type:complete len:219 (-) Transcript_6706:450-1106(-)
MGASRKSRRPARPSSVNDVLCAWTSSYPPPPGRSTRIDKINASARSRAPVVETARTRTESVLLRESNRRVGTVSSQSAPQYILPEVFTMHAWSTNKGSAAPTRAKPQPTIFPAPSRSTRHACSCGGAHPRRRPGPRMWKSSWLRLSILAVSKPSQTFGSTALVYVADSVSSMTKELTATHRGASTHRSVASCRTASRHDPAPSASPSTDAISQKIASA